MRITLLNQYFPPDPAPTGHYLLQLAQELASRGHLVRVLCGGDQYAVPKNETSTIPNDSNYIKIEIMPKYNITWLSNDQLRKLINYFIYIMFILLRLLNGPRQNVIIALTTPPYLGIIARYISLIRGSSHAHWVMDLYPDCLCANGMAPTAPIYKILGSFARRQWGGSSLVFTIGKTMAFRMKMWRKIKINTFPLWASPESPSSESINKVEIGNEKLKLLYAGNLGIAHRWIDFANCALRMGIGGPQWVFSGGGKRRKDFEAWSAMHPGLPIEFLPYISLVNLRDHLQNADVHLVSLENNWVGCVVPSKLQAIFSLGKPVIAVVPKWSETGCWVNESGGGWQVDPGDLENLIRAVNEASNIDERKWRGTCAKKYSDSFFKKSLILEQMCYLIENCRQ
jgi:colanic acid biosynthesis glycosyl transferase WcaI